MFVFAGESLNTSYLSPYLESLGSDFSHGVNFAVVGSSTLPKFRPFNLNIQVLQFLRFKSRSLEIAHGTSLLILTFFFQIVFNYLVIHLIEYNISV